MLCVNVNSYLCLLLCIFSLQPRSLISTHAISPIPIFCTLVIYLCAASFQLLFLCDLSVRYTSVLILKCYYMRLHDDVSAYTSQFNDYLNQVYHFTEIGQFSFNVDRFMYIEYSIIKFLFHLKRLYSCLNVVKYIHVCLFSMCVVVF